MRIYYLAIAVLLLFSCKKDELHKESFSGIVLHNVTKQPVANQLVSLGVTTYKLGPKDAEFPNGRPIYTDYHYSATTDNNGKFNFNFEVSGEWLFFASVVTGEYIQKIPPKNFGVFFPNNPSALPTVRDRFDTLFVEKTGYVRYLIKNINDKYNEDSLFVRTHYQNKYWSTRDFYIPSEHSEYNWGFSGPAVDYVMIDSIPVESEPMIPVKWLHRRSAVIDQKNEMTNVFPGSVTDYTIHY